MSKTNYYKAINPENAPYDMVYAQIEDDQVQFSHAGGGFVKRIDLNTFNSLYKEATAIEWQEYVMPNKMGLVCFDDCPSHPCYLSDQTWNGWAMPAFPAMPALEVSKSISDDEYYKFYVERNGKDIPIHEVDELEPTDVIFYYDLSYEDEDPIRLEPVIINGESTWAVGSGEFCWNRVERESEVELSEDVENLQDSSDDELSI